MADTPENTAASRGKSSRWRRLWRRSRLVGGVGVRVVFLLALFAWPISHVWFLSAFARRTSVVTGAVSPEMVNADTTARRAFIGAVSVASGVGRIHVAFWRSGDSRASPSIERTPVWESNITTSRVHGSIGVWNSHARDAIRRHVEFLGLHGEWALSPGARFGGFTLKVPFWMIALATAYPAARLVWKRLWPTRGPTECVTCGYSRVGLPSRAACPECGAASGEKVKTNAEDTKVIGGG
ncbi:MAG: hypothetical protein AB7Q00_11350 [Phycisphaerales bacterium]